MALVKLVEPPASMVTTSLGHVEDITGRTITPEMFGAFPNGVDCGVQFEQALRYVATNGGVLQLSKGTYYLGTTRFSYAYADGLKRHAMVGCGDSTTLKFGDIPPSGLGPTQNWTKETPLFQYVGNSGSQYIPEVTFKDFRIDYSEQSNKGGTSLDTLSITHPTPYSLGVWAMYFMYALRPKIEGVVFNEIYGDGVVFRKSTMYTVRDCSFFNVSAGNILTRYAPQNMASDSNGGCIFGWACHGGLIENNLCWNTRTYQASVASIDNGTQIKDTLCGYIGIWSEYTYNQNYPTESAPPLINTYLSQANLDSGWNNEALGCVIRNNTVYGYTLGIKTEGFNEAHVKDNVVLNTYIPILAANTRGLIDGNWTDMLYCDNRTCPQGGFQSIRSSITAHNFVSTFDGARVGLTLSNNKCYCVNYAGFRASRTGVTIEKNMFRFARGAAWPFDVNLGTNVDGVVIRDNLFFFDTTIASAVTANLQYHVGTQFIGNRFINLSGKEITLAFRNNCDGLNIQGNVFDGKVFVALQCRGYLKHNTFINSNAAKGARLQVTASAVVSENNFQCLLGATNDTIRLVADDIKFVNNYLSCDGSGTLPSGALVSAPGGNKGLVFTGNVTLSNPGSLPMLYVFGAHYPVFDRNTHTGGPLLKTAGSLYAPVTIGYNVAPSLFETAPASELNAVGNISPSFTPYQGMRMLYLLPASGGKEGLVYTGESTGWKSFGSIS